MIVELLDKVDRISQQFVFSGYQNLVNEYTSTIYMLIVLSLTIYGYAVAQGWSSFSLEESSKRVLAVGFVLSLALEWGNFSRYIYDLFTITPNEIASVLIKSIPNSKYADVTNINYALQQAWNDGISFASALWDRGDWHHWFPFIWAIIVLVLIIVLVGIALIELIVAKFGLATLLVISPLMIPMIIFKPTKEILFDGWVKHSVGFALVPIFVLSSLALGLTLLADSVVDIQNAINADTLTITATAPYVIYIIVAIGLVIKATHIAASIGNGFSHAMAPQFARGLHFIMNNLLPKRNGKKPAQPFGASVSIPHNPSTLSPKN